MNIRRRTKKYDQEALFGEVLSDSHRRDIFDEQQMEGTMQQPLSTRVFWWAGAIISLVAAIFIIKLVGLQLVQGDAYAALSDQNRFNADIIFNERGAILDRDGEVLAWNYPRQDGEEFSSRGYIDEPGFGHLLGYVSYPRRDDKGFFWQQQVVGESGAEQLYDEMLRGQLGYRYTETDVFQESRDASLLEPPIDGQNLRLSIDADLQQAFGEILSSFIERQGYEAAAAVVIDVHDGSLHSMVSVPEFSPTVMTDRDQEHQELISEYFNDESKPFLNRVVSGTYSPGSVVKPFVALAALHEGLVTPSTIIYSTGRIEIPNPYVSSKPSIFRDWDRGGHGPTDIYLAIAESVNTYFYAISGGWQDQEGLGIRKINNYMQLFGVGYATGSILPSEHDGVVPSPAWKRRVFDDPWRLGDTYITSIGQFGFEVTPLQMARSVAALANSGELLVPTLLAGQEPESVRIDEIGPGEYAVIRDAMRQTVTRGTADALEDAHVSVAAKTGTAQVNVSEGIVHSWLVGFYPYENPEVAFAVVLERGPKSSDAASKAFAQVLERYQELQQDRAEEQGGQEEISAQEFLPRDELRLDDM